jgi:hypothetical protein
MNQGYPTGHPRWNRPGSGPLLIPDGPLPANLALARADGPDEVTGVALMPTLLHRAQQRLET